MTKYIKEKAYASGIGLSQYMADFLPATFADVADNEVLATLINTHENTDIYKLHCNITIFSGQLEGQIQLGTAGTLGLVMYNSKAQTVNLASIPLDIKGAPFIADTAQPSAFILGAMGFDDVIIATDNLTDAINCYTAYISADVSVTVITSIVPSLFKQMVEEFEQVRHITVILTALPADKLKLKQLEGLNVTAIVSEHTPIYEALSYGESYNDLIADADIIDLKGVGHPQPTPITQTLPPVKTITSDMLPKNLWRYTDNQALRLSTPHEYIGVPLVIGLASTIGTKVSIFPKMLDDWETIPNLWGAIIGNPSTKKSPALSAGVKPLHNLTFKAKEQYEHFKKEFATQKEVNEFKTKAAREELKKLAKEQAKQADDTENPITDDDLKAKAQSIAEASEADETAPMLKRYITDDSTYQKLGELLSQTHNGLLVERDELTGLLAALKGEQNEEARNFYLEAYNGTGSKIMDRVMRGSIFIDKHCLSVVGGIQPDKLEHYLSNSIKGLGNDGLMQRFQLSVYPDHIKGRKEKDIAVDKGTRQAVYDLFEIIDNMTIGDFIKYGACKPDQFCNRPHYRFTKEAAEHFLQWYDHNTAKAESSDHTIISEHLMKYTKTVPSLALIFHLIDCIEYDANLGGVSLTALQTAIKWQKMLETHMYRIYSLVTDSANIKAHYLSEKILKVAEKGTDKTDITDWLTHGFTARQLIRRGWKGLTATDDVLNALEVLIEHDWLTWESVPSTGRGGRPTERYYINPRVSELL